MQELWNYVRAQLDKLAKDPNHLAQEPTHTIRHVLCGTVAVAWIRIRFILFGIRMRIYIKEYF